MSIGQPLSGITFSGLSSGIDVNSIVSQLMTLERIPLSRFNNQKAAIENRQQIYSQLKSRVTSFNASLSQLSMASAFKPMKVTVGDSNIATVTASDNAVTGSYELQVSNLATAHKLSSSGQASTGTALGLTGEFKINDKSLTITAGDSLATIASNINGLEAGVSASVVNGGTNQAYLIMTSAKTGVENAIELEDVSGGALASLGLNLPANELVEAKDAAYKLDGIALTNASNTISDVIPGATITLLKANATTPEKTTIALARDNGKIKDSLKAVMSAYNEVTGFIRTYSKFDTESYESGPLFGDSYAAQVESSLTNTLFNNIGTGDIRNLSQLGFSFAEDGKLKLDETTLDKLLETNLEGVKNLIASTGSSDSTALSYVSSGLKTVSSDASGYQVNITQAASKSLLTAAVGQTDPHVGGEILTFSGSIFGSKTVNLNINANASQADLVELINNHADLKNSVLATIEGGALKIESKRYGAAGGFVVSSNLVAASNNSGIGTAGASAYTAGLDVMGTINGEAATGNGQFLMGDAENATTAGLQLQYTGSATGDIGKMVFTQGLANTLVRSGNIFTDTVNGLFTSLDKSMGDQVTYLNQRVAELEATLVTREQYLRVKFAAMEEAIAKMQSQQSQLGAIFSSYSK